MEVTKNQKDFAAISFCCNALDSKIKTSYAQAVCIKDGQCIATDSRKLFVDNCNLPKGIYKVIKKTKQRISFVKDNTIKFPHYRTITDDLLRKQLLCSVCFGANKEANINKLIKALPAEIGINTEHLKPLEGSFDVYHNPKSPKSPLFFLNGSRLAIIMPLDLSKI